MTAHDDAMPDDITDAEAFDFDPPLSWDPGEPSWAPTPPQSDLPVHGPRCSSDPEIGCECGYAEWASERDEALNAPAAS